MEYNQPKIRWKALPSSEKAHFKQLSEEDAKRVRMEMGLEDKENKAPAKKRSKKKVEEENETPAMKTSKMEALIEDQGALKESEMLLESNNQEGDHVGGEHIAAEEVAEVATDVMGGKIVQEGNGILKESDSPGAMMVEIEFGSVEMDRSVNIGNVSASDCNTIEAVANRDILSKEEDAHVEDEDEEEDSEDELERSLAAEMYEVTVGQDNRSDETTEEEGAGANAKSGLQQDDTFEGVAVEQGCVPAHKDLLQTKDCLDLMQVSEADDEVVKDGDWQWGEVDQVEENGGGEVAGVNKRPFACPFQDRQFQNPDKLETVS